MANRTEEIRVLALYDYPGWAWEHRLNNVRRHLPADIRMDIQELYGDFAPCNYDLFLVLEEYLLPNLQFLPPQKIIAGSSTARVAMQAVQALRTGRCGALVFNSREMADLAGRHPHVWCCQNGVDADFFSPAVLPPGEFTACWVGNSTSICEKGLDIIQIACREAGVPLLYRDQAVNMKAWTQAEVRDRLYRSACVYICASKWEGTPNPALEAMACGLPVISTPVGNMPEIIRNGGNGFLVERSVGAIVDALGRVRHCWQEMGRSARAGILEGWTWEQQSRKYAAMFRAEAEVTGPRLTAGSYRAMALGGILPALRAGKLPDALTRLAWSLKYTPIFQCVRHGRQRIRSLWKRLGR